MVQSDDNNRKREERDRDRINELLSFDPKKMELWRYYSDRADRFADQLWSTGTWLLAVTGSILTVPFAGNLVVVDYASVIEVKSNILTLLVSILGAVLCLYSYWVLTDIRNHIQRNWERADLVRKGKWEPSEWGGAKSRGWWTLMAFFACALLAFVSLGVFAIGW